MYVNRRHTNKFCVLSHFVTHNVRIWLYGAIQSPLLTSRCLLWTKFCWHRNKCTCTETVVRTESLNNSERFDIKPLGALETINLFHRQGSNPPFLRRPARCQRLLTAAPHDRRRFSCISYLCSCPQPLLRLLPLSSSWAHLRSYR